MSINTFSGSNITYTHNLNNKYVLTNIYDENGYQIQPNSLTASLNSVEFDFTTPISGFVVVKQAEYSQSFTSTTSVNVSHSFNTESVVVNAFDTNDTLIIPDLVTISGSNNVIVDFSGNTSGYINVSKHDYTQSFTSVSQSNITHGLGTKNILVSVYDNNNEQIVPDDIQLINDNTASLTFTSNTTGNAVVVEGDDEIVCKVYRFYNTSSVATQTSDFFGTAVTGTLTFTDCYTREEVTITVPADYQNRRIQNSVPSLTTPITSSNLFITSSFTASVPNGFDTSSWDMTRLEGYLVEKQGANFVNGFSWFSYLDPKTGTFTQSFTPDSRIRVFYIAAEWDYNAGYAMFDIVSGSILGPITGSGASQTVNKTPVLITTTSIISNPIVGIAKDVDLNFQFGGQTPGPTVLETVAQYTTPLDLPLIVTCSNFGVNIVVHKLTTLDLPIPLQIPIVTSSVRDELEIRTPANLGWSANNTRIVSNSFDTSGIVAQTYDVYALLNYSTGSFGSVTHFPYVDEFGNLQDLIISGSSGSFRPITALQSGYHNNSFASASATGSPIFLYPEIYIGSASVTQSESACVPITVGDYFQDILTWQGTINFDPNIITYVSASNNNIGLTLFNPIPGNLTFAWISPYLTGSTFSSGSTLLELCFSGSESGSSNLQFTGFPTDLEISNLGGVISASYFSGSFEVAPLPLPPSTSVYIGTASVSQSNGVCVPITVGDGFENVLTWQGTIAYNEFVLNYVTASNNNLGITLFNPTSGSLTFSWISPYITGSTFSSGSTLFEVCFTASEGGFSELEFTSSPTLLEMGDNSGSIFVVDYFTGSIFVTPTTSSNIDVTLYLYSTSSEAEFFDILYSSASDGPWIIAPSGSSIDLLNLYSYTVSIPTGSNYLKLVNKNPEYYPDNYKIHDINFGEPTKGVIPTGSVIPPNLIQSMSGEITIYNDGPSSIEVTNLYMSASIYMQSAFMPSSVTIGTGSSSVFIVDSLPTTGSPVEFPDQIQLVVEISGNLVSELTGSWEDSGSNTNIYPTAWVSGSYFSSPYTYNVTYFDTKPTFTSESQARIIGTLTL